MSTSFSGGMPFVVMRKRAWSAISGGRERRIELICLLAAHLNVNCIAIVENQKITSHAQGREVHVWRLALAHFNEHDAEGPDIHLHVVFLPINHLLHDE